MDTKELRRKLRSGDIIDHIDIHANVRLILTEILDRLEEAEETKNNWLRANAPGGWIDDLRMERNALHARIKDMEKERNDLRNEIACVKEVEFPRKAQAVADAWKGKCNRLEAECDALRVRIEVLEKQELGFREMCAPSSSGAKGEIK